MESLNQPESVLGIDSIIINFGSFQIESDATYILSTDGLNFNDIKINNLSSLKNNNDWYNFANNLKKEVLL